MSRYDVLTVKLEELKLTSNVALPAGAMVPSATGKVAGLTNGAVRSVAPVTITLVASTPPLFAMGRAIIRVEPICESPGFPVTNWTAETWASMTVGVITIKAATGSNKRLRLRVLHTRSTNPPMKARAREPGSGTPVLTETVRTSAISLVTASNTTWAGKVAGTGAEADRSNRNRSTSGDVPPMGMVKLVVPRI